MMIVYTIVILCVLIFVHELGHFGAAKLSGVRVNEFALGMGPAFFKKQIGETKYSLRVFPIGGFCSMEGEDETSDDLRSFGNKPAWIRAIILAAGSFMNVVLAVIVMSAIIFYAGTGVTTIINEIRPDSPAEIAGLLSGDKITAIDGVEIKQWRDVVEQIAGAAENKISIVVLRSGSKLSIETNLTTAEDGRKIIGITPTVTRNPLRAVVLGTQASFDMLRNMVSILGQLFTGNVPASELTGPVGIAYIVDDTVKYGIRPVLYLVALISLNLAIVNMLPFPALDGGRLVFLAIRKMTGKMISDSVEARFHIIGMVMLLALMVFVTWSDIDKLIRGVLW